MKANKEETAELMFKRTEFIFNSNSNSNGKGFEKYDGKTCIIQRTNLDGELDLWFESLQDMLEDMSVENIEIKNSQV